MSMEIKHKDKVVLVNSFQEFSSILAGKNEIVMNDRDGVKVCVYLLAKPDTFDHPAALECRGMVFHGDEVISRPLHKFFNVNERPETAVDLLPWDKVVRVMKKRDGSMIHTCKAMGDVKAIPGTTFNIKSKKAFDSDVANQARDWMKTKPGHLSLCQFCVDSNYTAIFEYTAPTARIVVYYPEENMKLLHVRNNFDGRYLSGAEIHAMGKMFDVPVVEDDPVIMELIAEDPMKLFEKQETVTGVEGWVIQFEDGDMVKFKTKWYLHLHHNVTFLRERDIAELVIDEKIDDLKSLMVEERMDITQICKIERKVVEEINLIKSTVEGIYQGSVAGGYDKRTAAVKMKDTLDPGIFGLMMKMYDGKEPNYVKYFKKSVLNEMFTLRQIDVPNVDEE